MRQSIRDLLTDAALDYVGHFMEPKPIQAGFFFGTHRNAPPAFRAGGLPRCYLG